MFGRKKRIAEEKALLNKINLLLKDATISDEEYKILKNAKNSIEHQKNFTRILADLESSLRPLAINSQLTKDVAQLYSSIINEAYRDSGWSGMMFF